MPAIFNSYVSYVELPEASQYWTKSACLKSSLFFAERRGDAWCFSMNWFEAVLGSGPGSSLESKNWISMDGGGILMNFAGYIYIYIYMYIACVYIYIYVYITCMYIYIYIMYIYIYIHWVYILHSPIHKVGAKTVKICEATAVPAVHADIVE